ncbi:GCFC2 factor, partial [Piprites chloris]|nr:GCFC2 factor [Piprites chloris]
GRQRAASSGSSEDEPEPEPRPGPVAAPSPDSGAVSPSEQEAEPEEGERDSPGVCCLTERWAEGAGAAGRLLRLCEQTLRCRVVGEEFFKVKKPSFNEVTFRIQKKESLLPAQRESEESKKIFQLEPGTGNSSCQPPCKEEDEEKEGETYSSLNQNYNSSDSENDSSSPQRRKDLSPGDIPSAAHVESARKRRHLARTKADYLPLDVSNSLQVSRGRRSSDFESEDESETKNIDFAPRMKTLRQRMTEQMGEFVLFLPVAL